jgi:hypothetical protein
MHMAFRVHRLLGNVDFNKPAWSEIAAYVERGASFLLEGDDDGAPASFSVETSGAHSFVQVEAPSDRDQNILTDRARGDAPIGFVSDGNEYTYPAFCLVGRDLLITALQHFVQTGQREPSLSWMPVSELLENYEVF